jgi:hypothetical protein
VLPPRSFFELISGLDYDWVNSMKVGSGKSATLTGSVSALAADRGQSQLGDAVRDHARSSAVLGAAMADTSGLGELFKTVSRSVGPGPITKVLGDAVRDHARSSAVLGAAMADTSGLGELFKTVTAGMWMPPGVKSLIEEMSRTSPRSSAASSVAAQDLSLAGDDPIGHPLDTASPATVGVRGAEIYAALVALIVLALLVACWLHEAERVGPDFAEVNRFATARPGTGTATSPGS